MKNLEEIKREYERKIKEATIANDFEKIFGIENPIVVSYNDKIRMQLREISIAKAAEVLNKIPAQKKFVVNKTASGNKNPVEALYKIGLHRGFRDIYSNLSVNFYNNGIEYYFEIPMIDEAYEFLKDFFEFGKRMASESEISTYHPMDSQMKLRTRMDLPCLKFVKNQIQYSSGFFFLLDLDEIDRIVNTLKGNVN